jgi:alpha-tubulin suppressor-like RCC1 family protein
MLSRKSFLILAIGLLFISNVGLASMCARLKSVSAGESHSMALMDDGTLWACGRNSEWQLGIGGSEPVYSLRQVKGENGIGFLKNIATYDAGLEHSLAADTNGTIWAWGDDYYGQLGNGLGNDPCEFPTKVHGLNNDGNLSDTVDIVYVSAGRSGYHSLAVDSNGYVYAWGRDDSGQCGDGSKNTREETPKLVLDDDPETEGNYLGDIAHIIRADAGVNHSIALDDEGHVWHWGSGSYRETYPEKVKTSGGQELSNITQIASCYHSVAVDSSGNVWEWTDSGVAYGGAYKVPGGQMGTTYLENIAEVSAGNGCSMARTNNGHVLVWSNGEYAYPEYIEDGEMQTQSGLLEGIVSISAGYYDHKLAVCENGYGWAWGNNNGDGQFGVGDTNSHPEPTQMLCAEASSSIYLTKTGSEPNCVRPFDVNNYLVYEICYGNPITNPSDPNYYGSVHEVNIIDHLPVEVNFYSAPGGGYDGNTRTVKWTIGELEPGQEGCFTLTVTVNEYARPGGEISNFVEMTADKYHSYTSNTLPVCNWGTEIIYVDKDAAAGHNNGTNWDDAYTDLRDAFIGVQNLGADITAIWVAAGTYKPTYDINETNYQSKSFELLEDVGLFGHFGGVGTYETSTSQRNFADANNETILEGKIGSSASQAVQYVVKAQDIIDGLVDGFTIKGAYNGGAGAYLDGSNASIVNCKFKNNNNYGVRAVNFSYPDIHNCLFMNNSSYAVYSDTSEPDTSYCIFDGNNTTPRGLYLTNGSVSNITNSNFKNHTVNAIEGYYATVNIEGCKLSQNGYHGVEGLDLNLAVKRTVLENNTQNGIRLSSYSNLDIENCVIRKSGYQGVYLSQNSVAEIINSWIHNNGTSMDSSYGAGVYFEDQIGIPTVWNNTIYDNYTYGIECSEDGADPNIRNCIIAGNDSNDLCRVNGSFNKVNYCLLQHTHSGSGNITGDTGFMNPADPNDLHLDETSQCKDFGDPDGNYSNETDIDGENRVYYGRVDIGADEYYWSSADFDRNGIVNFLDYAVLASAWLTDNPNISLDDDNDVDIYDLSLFCQDWLWEASWSDTQWMMSMSGGDGGMGLGLENSELDSTGNRDALMLSTATESLKARPERLIARSRKFYDITPETTISAMGKALHLQPQYQAKPEPAFELQPEPQLQVQSAPELLQPEPQPTEEPQQQSMLAGPNETPGIWLVYDGNMTPDSGDEITVYIHSDPMLLYMDTVVEVLGNANITTAMSEADCNSFGWDNDWNSDYYIYPSGLLYISGVSLESVVNGTVGYLKFRYNSGEVTVSITEDSCAYNAPHQPVLFSPQPLIFGRDPNQN